MFVGIQKRFGPYRLQTLTTQGEDGPECQQAGEGDHAPLREERD
jgi:hypothetical protein